MKRRTALVELDRCFILEGGVNFSPPRLAGVSRVDVADSHRFSSV